MASLAPWTHRLADPVAALPTELAVLRGIAIGRWATWFWLVGVAVLSRERIDRPAVVAVALAAALSVTVVHSVVEWRPAARPSLGLLVVEFGVAMALWIADGVAFGPGHVGAGQQSIAGDWPLIAVISMATRVGPWRGAVLGLALAAARISGFQLNGGSLDADSYVSFAASAVFYAIFAFVGGSMVRLLRRVETEVLTVRARENVARTLHDGVLQTLAIVERRTRSSDPELADLARASDRELRAWLFHGVGPEALSEPGLGLEARLRAVAERTARHHGLSPTVNVIDDETALDDAALAAIAGAVGEALTNAAKHADARHVTVFAENDDGVVFASVRDDGVGFDPSNTKIGEGIRRSIEGRIKEVGGRVEIESSPGTGTEVRIWSK